jgi:hypothetical protein
MSRPTPGPLDQCQALRQRAGDWARRPPGPEEGACGLDPIVFRLRPSLTAFGRSHSPLSAMAELAALDPRLSPAPGLDQGSTLALRAAAFSRASEASTAALDPGLDRQLDSGLRSPARPRAGGGLPRRDCQLVPVCDRALNSPRVKLRRPPAS